MSYYGLVNPLLLLFYIIPTIISLDEITTASQNPICPNSGTDGFEINSTQSTTFHHRSHYYSSDKGDSVQLRVVNGADGTNNYKFIAYDNSYTDPIVKEAANSKQAYYEFVSLINQILVLKNTDSNTFHAYKFQQTAGSILPKITLEIPASFISLIKFIPFYVSDGQSLIIGLSTSSQSGIFKYVWPQELDTSITSTQIGLNLAHSFTTLTGNEVVFIDSSQSKIMLFDFLNSDYSEYTPSPAQTGRTLNSFPLRLNNLICTFMEPDNLDGDVMQFNNISQVETITLVTSTTQFQSFTDQVSNFLIVGSSHLIWKTVQPSDGSIISTKILITASFTPNFDGLVTAALSSNKLIALYDNKIEYYQHISSGTIQKIKENSFLSSQMNIGQQGKWRIALKCSCIEVLVTSFSCFSSTIQCLVVTQNVTINCIQENDWTS